MLRNQLFVGFRVLGHSPQGHSPQEELHNSLKEKTAGTNTPPGLEENMAAAGSQDLRARTHRTWLLRCHISTHQAGGGGKFFHEACHVLVSASSNGSFNKGCQGRYRWDITTTFIVDVESLVCHRHVNVLKNMHLSPF